MKIVIFLKDLFLNLGVKYKDGFDIFFLNLGLVFGIVGLLYIFVCFFIVCDVKIVC